MQKEGNQQKLSLITDNRGTTMVTVIISFALLLLLVTGYYKTQRMSENMMMSAKDMILNNSQLIKAYYLEETTNKTVADQVELSFSGQEGSFIINATLNRADKEGLEGTIYYFGAITEEPAEE